MSEMFIGPLGEAAKKIRILEEEIDRVKNSVTSGDFKTSSLAIFQNHPEVEAISWNQYTPYFNDGEPCTFSVHDCEVKFTTQEAVNKYCDYKGSFEEFHYMGWAKGHGNPELQRAVNEFSDFIQNNSGLMETLFGDHSKITIHSSGVTVEHLEHD